ncbi:MAG: hypothetical protein R3A80_10030 [Bdellovibrionota bacterium]
MISVKEIKDLKHEIAKVLGTQDEIVDIIRTEISDPSVIDLATAVKDRMDSLRLALIEIEKREEKVS